jgi:putative peptidoglycan lipid II flippase
MTEQARQYRDMAKTASWTMVSRVLGLVRDQLIAGVFGASAVGAAFLFAFQIPNLFRRLLGEGALTAAIVPVLAEKTAREGRPAAYGFLNDVLRRILPGMLALTLLGIGLALLWAFLRPSDANAALLTAACMPYMPLICVAALFTSAVNLSGRFGLAEIASGLLNLCMIAGLGLFGLLADTEMGKAGWLCAGAIAGGALQLLIPLQGLRQEGWRPGPSQPDPVAWRTLSIAFLPAALGAGIQQINFLVSRGLAFKVSDAGLTYYYLANRIVELPIGLFSASIAVVMFPALAMAFAQGDRAALARNYARGARLILAVNVAAAFGLAVLAGPIVQLLFEFGRFSPKDCQQTSVLLVLFAVAMPFYALISLTTRALNVAGQTRVTLIAAVHALIVNFIGSMAALFLGFGVEGLAIANALSTIWQYLVLRHYLRRLAPEFLTEPLLKATLQVLVGSLLLGIIAYQSTASLRLLGEGHLPTKVNLALAMTIGGGVAMLVYAFYLDCLRYPERDLLRGFANKLLRPIGFQLKV